MKASLHESGKWHLAYSPHAFEDHVKGAVPTQHDRFLKKWERPKPIAAGMTLAYQIVTPYSAVTSPISDNDRNVTWIPNCPPMKATMVYVFIVSPLAHFTGWPGKAKMNTRQIGSYKLANGEEVWAVYREIAMPDFTKLNDQNGCAYPYNQKDGDDPLNCLRESDGLRMLAFGEDSEGKMMMYDCAVEREVS